MIDSRWHTLYALGSICQINIEMKIREEIVERIEAGNFADDLLTQAEKATFVLMKQSVIPMWKNSALFREGLKQHGVKSLNELRVQKTGKSSKSQVDDSQLGTQIQMEQV